MAGSYDHRSSFNIISWNINGVKEKFNIDQVTSLFENIDIVIIGETHFGIRTKCPIGFEIVGRSTVVESKKLRDHIQSIPYKAF